MRSPKFLKIVLLFVVSYLFLASTAFANPPVYYPSDYSKLIQKSKSEHGLLIYSNAGATHMAKAIEAFNKMYPWIGVEVTHKGPDAAFEDYLVETAIGGKTADIIISGAVNLWPDFVDQGNTLSYRSPESEYLPHWSISKPGMYVFSTDPTVLVYNRKLLAKKLRPKGLSDLKRLLVDYPKTFSNRLMTYDATAHAWGYSIHWAAIQHKGWDYFNDISKDTTVTLGGSDLIKKVAAGEAVVSYYVSFVSLSSKLDDPKYADIGWNLIYDGTPVFPRGMAITKSSKNQASAKLLLDFFLSHKGQVELAKGGLTPYRPGIEESEVPYFTLDSLEKELGTNNLLLIDYSSDMKNASVAFKGRWSSMFVTTTEK